MNENRIAEFNEKFNLEVQYDLYLQRVGLKQSAMHPIQNKLMKDSFLAACGIMLVMLRDDLGAIDDEMEAIYVMENLMTQVSMHFDQYK